MGGPGSGRGLALSPRGQRGECSGQQRARGFSGEKGPQSARLASVFSLNDQSRSARGWGRRYGKGLGSLENIWTEAWDGISVWPTQRGDVALVSPSPEPRAEGRSARIDTATRRLRSKCPSCSQALSEDRTWALSLSGTAGPSLGPSPGKLRVGTSQENKIPASFHFPGPQRIQNRPSES